MTNMTLSLATFAGSVFSKILYCTLHLTAIPDVF